MLVFGDFESYYDDICTLRKMTPLEYLWHPLFSVNGCALAVDDKPSIWVDGDVLPRVLDALPWDEIDWVSHNIGFDGLLLAEIYNLRPRRYIDTLGMSRAINGPRLANHSLKAVLNYLGFPPKGDAIQYAKGYDLAALRANPPFFRTYKQYAIDDNDGARNIFNHLAPRVPPAQWDVMDSLARLITEPQLALDMNVLRYHQQQVKAQKAQAIASIIHLSRNPMADPETAASQLKHDLSSNLQFAQILADLGVEPPRKKSPTTGLETWAFSKQDPAFLDLQEHPDPSVQAVVSARLGIKSTLEETRTARFIALADLSEQRGTPLIPLPLKYSAAHTHRFGGDWKTNAQNLGRDSLLRAALVAPAGYRVVAADASQIECRIEATVAEQHDLVQQFREDKDVYAELASSIIGSRITKATHPTERFMGKTAQLGLGYGMGPPKFVLAARVQSKGKVRITLDQSRVWVGGYRARNTEIVQLWNRCATALVTMMETEGFVQIGPCVLGHEHILLPSGLMIQYPDLRRERTDRGLGFVYTQGNMRKHLFGGKVVENIVQALAAIAVVEAAQRVYMRTGYRMALQIHDALIFVVPEEIAEDVLAVLIEELSRSPIWLRDAPLSAEGGIGITLAAAEQDAGTRKKGVRTH